MTNQEMQTWIEQKISHYINIWNTKSDVLVINIPSKFNLRGQTAGYFCYRSTGNYFRWNLALALENQDTYTQTVGHEVAHLITHTLDKINNRKTKPHGWLWQSVMQNLGLKIQRCHDYKCEPARKVSRPIKRICPLCKVEDKITLTKYKNFLKRMSPSGQTAYKCKCGRIVNVLQDCKPCIN